MGKKKEPECFYCRYYERFYGACYCLHSPSCSNYVKPTDTCRWWEEMHGGRQREYPRRLKSEI